MSKAKKFANYVIMDMSGDECRYLSHFEAFGPVFKTKPVVFKTKRDADNVLARARNAGWLTGDLELIRY